MRELDQLAEKFRIALQQEQTSDIAPLFDSFPNNCCEHTSVLFGYFLNIKMPELTVEIIRGVKRTDECDLEYHLWLEVDGLIYDLTVDQFEECNIPVYGATLHPLNDLFIEDKREYLGAYMTEYFDKVLELPRFSKILSLTCNYMKMHDK